MTIEELQQIAGSYPSVTEDIKWENHLCFNIGGKMFLILGMDNIPVTASFKVKDEDFDRFSDREGYEPAPYLARYRWIKVDDINRMHATEWAEAIGNAYRLIRLKLPKKVQKELHTFNE